MVVVLAACSSGNRLEPADVLFVNSRVYTLSWDEPSLEGKPAANAPHNAAGWHPDAEAVAVRGGKIVFAGSNRNAERHKGPATRVIDLKGATVLPGIIDSHVHIVELGQSLSRIDVRGLQTEEQTVSRVREAAEKAPAGQWIEAYGWDDGAWASHLPDMKLLSKQVPNHPVYLKGLHGFSVWGNRLAFERAGITSKTPSPTGGEISKDKSGYPTGILTNTAVRLLEAAIPPPTVAQLRSFVLKGLNAMARAGYVAVHEAGAGSQAMQALEALEADGQLPLRVYAMIAARDDSVMQTWLAKGPDRDVDSMLVTRSVKAFYDAALGSRGARLLEDYSDRPGHKGVAGNEYEFRPESMTRMMQAGFQLVIHAIGDAGNRETLDYLESALRAHPGAAANRHRIEHAQVLHPDDIPRFARSGIIASMEPPHAVEDKAWAEARLGPQRVRYAYAWRSLRRSGARLTFNSDLPGSDYNFFYGLHSAVSRRDKEGKPEGGWYPEQCLTPEESLRAYTLWAAYASFMESQTGTISPGKWADITVMDLDPLNIGEKDPEKLLQGRIVITMVAGKIVFESSK
jgi:predicted amidohydrolase YtcJ